MTPTETRLRDELRTRRRRLAEVTADGKEVQLADLLRRVDATLARFETPDWGLCTRCHDPIEAELLRAVPDHGICLECLSPSERRALELDLAGARRVQRKLLPPSEIAHQGWEVAWLWEPRGAVSGDHVDMLHHREGEGALDLLLGDVAGKGVAASLLQSHLHALFRALAEPPRPLGEILRRANQLLSRSTSDSDYATLVASRLHADGTAEIANAGHPRPLLADRRGVRPIEGAGLPLGLFGEGEYQVRELCLEPGDTLLFYTDGWTEAVTARGEYGVGRASAALTAAADRPLEEVLAACRGDMERFLEGAERPDDLTLLVVRRAAGPR